MSQLIENYWNSIFDVEVPKKAKRNTKVNKSKDEEKSSNLLVSEKSDLKVNESSNERKATKNLDSHKSSSSKENYNKRVKLDLKLKGDSKVQKLLKENTDRIKKQVDRKDDKKESKEVPKKIVMEQQVVAQDDESISKISSMQVINKINTEIKAEEVKTSISMNKNLPVEVLKIKEEVAQNDRPKPSFSVIKTITKEVVKNKKDDGRKPFKTVTNTLPKEALKKKQVKKQDVISKSLISGIENIPTEVLQKKADPKEVFLQNSIAKKRAIEILKKMQSETKVAGFKPSISVVKDKPLVPEKKQEMPKRLPEKPKVHEKIQNTSTPAPVEISNEKY